MVYFHGNAETIITAEPEAKLISEKFGSMVVLVEYYGYYKSGSKKKDIEISEICNDAERQVREIKSLFPEAEIILTGRSIGTGVAGYVVSKLSCSKLILITPLAKINSEFFVPDDFKHIGVLFKNYSPEFFDNISVVKDLRVPILVIAAIDDQILPIKHTHALLKANPKIEVAYSNAGHNDFSLTDDEIADDVLKFMETGVLA
jgi:hypothetical protein